MLYLTDGYLLAKARSDPDLSNFKSVIIDEAHERPVPSDICLYYCRSALVSRGEDFRLVVMSATIDPTEFVEFFKRKQLTVNVVYAAGRPNYPIQTFFMKTTPDVKDSVKVANDTVLKVLNDSEGGDVIVFVATSKDADYGCKKFNENCKSACAESICSRLYSRLPVAEQK